MGQTEIKDQKSNRNKQDFTIIFYVFPTFLLKLEHISQMHYNFGIYKEVSFGMHQQTFHTWNDCLIQLNSQVANAIVGYSASRLKTGNNLYYAFPRHQIMSCKNTITNGRASINWKTHTISIRIFDNLTMIIVFI